MCKSVRWGCDRMMIGRWGGSSFDNELHHKKLQGEPRGGQTGFHVRASWFTHIALMGSFSHSQLFTYRGIVSPLVAGKVFNKRCLQQCCCFPAGVQLSGASSEPAWFQGDRADTLLTQRTVPHGQLCRHRRGSSVGFLQHLLREYHWNVRSTGQKQW